MKRYTEAGDLGGHPCMTSALRKGCYPIISIVNRHSKSSENQSQVQKWSGGPKPQKWLQTSSLDGPLAQHIEPGNLPELWAPQKIAAWTEGAAKSPSQTFWLKFGFRVVGRLQNFSLDDDNIWMSTFILSRLDWIGRKKCLEWATTMREQCSVRNVLAIFFQRQGEKQTSQMVEGSGLNKEYV